MANKGISEIPLFDPIFQKMDCPLFGVTTVIVFSVRIWKNNGGKYELQSNIQGEHKRSIYSVSWSEKGILTGAGDNFVRLFIERGDHTWSCMSSIEVKSDINSGKEIFTSL